VHAFVAIEEDEVKIMQYKYSHNPNNANFAKAVYLQNGQVSWLDSAIPGWHSTSGEPNNLIDVVIAWNQLCALDTSGFVYYCPISIAPPVWTKDPIASQGIALSSDDTGNLWLTNQKGEVWRRNLQIGGSWNREYANIPIGPLPTWNYTVKAGDWLLLIVRREFNTWGDDTKTVVIAEQVKVLNPGIANWDLLHPGDVLKMPPKTA
jgi:hypothetical protein